MIWRRTNLAIRVVVFLASFVYLMQGMAKAQDQEPASSTPAIQKMGPVGEEEAKPSKAAPPVNSVVDPGIIPSRQAITPAGLQSVFESRVNGIAFGENGDSVYAATLGQKGSHIYQIDLKSNQMIGVIDSSASAGMQGLIYDPVTQAPLMSGLSGSAKGKDSVVQFVSMKGSRSTVIADSLGAHQVGGVSLGLTKNSQGQRLGVIALTFDDAAAMIDMDPQQIVGKIRTGVAPFGTSVSRDSSIAYVSNWGGRFPNAGEQTAATGPEAHADQVLVDE